LKRVFKYYLFEQLNEKQFNLLKEISVLKSYKTGNIIFYEGDEPKHLILLVDGILQIYKTDYKGNKIILHNFYPNSLIAEIVNLEKIKYPASGEFITDGEALLIDYEKFEKYFLKDPEINFLFIKELTKKIKFLEDVIINNIVMDSTARVAKYIYEHEGKFKTLKKSQIAELLHLKPETLSRIFKKLKIINLITDNKGKIEIVNKEGLKALYSTI